MSASLVGSDMCIRDSLLAFQNRPTSLCSLPPAQYLPSSRQWLVFYSVGTWRYLMDSHYRPTSLRNRLPSVPLLSRQSVFGSDILFPLGTHHLHHPFHIRISHQKHPQIRRNKKVDTQHRSGTHHCSYPFMAPLDNHHALTWHTQSQTFQRHLQSTAYQPLGKVIKSSILSACNKLTYAPLTRSST